MVAYVRSVQTASGATAVQIVWSSRRGSRSIEHLGSAHDEAELAALKAAAAERLTANQAILDLGVTAPPGSEPLPITVSRGGRCRSSAVEPTVAVAYQHNQGCHLPFSDTANTT